MRSRSVDASLGSTDPCLPLSNPAPPRSPLSHYSSVGLSRITVRPLDLDLPSGLGRVIRPVDGGHLLRLDFGDVADSVELNVVDLARGPKRANCEIGAHPRTVTLNERIPTLLFRPSHAFDSNLTRAVTETSDREDLLPYCSLGIQRNMPSVYFSKHRYGARKGRGTHHVTVNFCFI
jgi:hypothetical protein